MTIGEVIADADLMATGKARTLATTSTRYIRYLALANLIQRKLIKEPDIQWDWTYDRVSLGTITSDRVDMDDSIYALHTDDDDPVYIALTGSNQRSYWKLVEPGDLEYYRYERVCAQIGSELVFTRTFASTDQEYSGEVFVPAHVTPDPFTSSSDDVLIPNPEYLSTMIAAESVRNTVTKQNQYGNLVADANNMLTSMRQRNTGSIQTARLRPSVLGESYLGNYPYAYANSYGQPLGDD